MMLLRLLVNAVILTVYAIRLVLFVIARVCGSIPGALIILLLLIAYTNGSSRVPPLVFYPPFLFVGLCRVSHPYLRPRSRPRFLQAPAPPPPPPPVAGTAKGRSDDPNEATVIGRLDPKLRDLLRPKSGGTAS